MARTQKQKGGKECLLMECGTGSPLLHSPLPNYIKCIVKIQDYVIVLPTGLKRVYIEYKRSSLNVNYPLVLRVCHLYPISLFSQC